MDKLVYTAATGLRAHMQSQAAIANNMANVSTTGFRADRVVFDRIILSDGSTQLSARQPTSEEVRDADRAPGVVQQTGRPLDVALGEILYALLRGLLYATGFMIIMQFAGLNLAWTAVLAIPAVLLIAFGFASLGMAVTSYMKAFQQMDWINFVMLPMFLFSATFYPLSVYPQGIQWFIQALPLWHGVELLRQLSIGIFTPATAVHITYYLVMILVGMVLTTTRLRKLFLK